MTFGRYVLTADVTVPAGVASFTAAGPASTASGQTSATPAAGTSIGAGIALSSGTWLLSWTTELQDAAAAGDADNFVLTAGTVTLATSVNPGAIGSYPQPAVVYYAAAAVTAVPKTGAAAGSAGSVYAASLTATPVMGGDNRGAVNWTGPGSPAEWTVGGFPAVFFTGQPLWLDTEGPLYAALGAANLRPWADGTDDVGHWGLSN
jgi:hypothetical protein